LNTKDFDIFKKIYKFYGIEIYTEDPLGKKKFYFTHTYKSEVEFGPFVLNMIWK
jgi:hypothetical protein